MAHDQQRRLFVRRRGVVVIPRRVEIAVGGKPALGGELDGSRDRRGSRRRQLFSRSSQHLEFFGRQIQETMERRLRRRRADENHAVTGDANLGDRREGQLDVIERSVARVERGEVVKAVPGVAADDLSFGCEAVEGEPKTHCGWPNSASIGHSGSTCSSRQR